MDNKKIELPESLTIHHIESQFGNLRSAFQTSEDTLVIDAAPLESIDTSGIQSLLALIKDSQKASKKIEWINIPEVLSSSAEKLGLTKKLLLA